MTSKNWELGRKMVASGRSRKRTGCISRPQPPGRTTTAVAGAPGSPSGPICATAS